MFRADKTPNYLWTWSWCRWIKPDRSKFVKVMFWVSAVHQSAVVGGGLSSILLMGFLSIRLRLNQQHCCCIFTCQHWSIVSFENAYFFYEVYAPTSFPGKRPWERDCLRPYRPVLIHARNADGNDREWRCFRRRFPKPPFSAIHTRRRDKQSVFKRFRMFETDFKGLYFHQRFRSF